MYFSTIVFGVAASSVLTGALAAPSSFTERQVVDTPCHNIHIFVARGSYEGYDQGSNRINQMLVPAICSGRPSCGYEDIVYPAVIGDDYCGSQTAGVHGGLGQLRVYTERCPNSKIVLAGYSQGAQVIGDMLGTSGPPSCDAGNPPLDPSVSPGNKIKAIAFFGDPRRTPGQSYNKGSAGKDVSGSFPRSENDLKALNKYGGKLASFCLAGDPHCTGGGDGAAHENVVASYHQNAAAFVKRKL